MTCIECSVIVKDENKKLVNKYLRYEALNMDLDDPEIQRMRDDTLSLFKVEVDSESPSIVLKTSMILQ